MGEEDSGELKLFWQRDELDLSCRAENLPHRELGIALHMDKLGMLHVSCRKGKKKKKVHVTQLLSYATYWHSSPPSFLSEEQVNEIRKFFVASKLQEG